MRLSMSVSSESNVTTKSMMSLIGIERIVWAIKVHGEAQMLGSHFLNPLKDSLVLPFSQYYKISYSWDKGPMEMSAGSLNHSWVSLCYSLR